MSIRSLGTALILSAAAGWAAVADAQVETIDPNPTMPRDVGGRLTYRGFSNGGGRLGRAKPGEENPAETLLRSIEGSNYGRATGHSIFSHGGSRGVTGDDVRRQSRSPDRPATLYYSQRGAYEDRVYHPGRGSYRSLERQQTHYRAQGEQRLGGTPSKKMPKIHDGGRTTERPRRAE
ncbi:MAG TPA: hypothetical protein VG125_07835 [Pirellulales bacterium]|jgi:hypothetical protein|nr:hypothetical protein [Pirellulales bacterium]